MLFRSAIINKNCGAVNALLLCDIAKDFDMTFAFDGDSDRLIALDEKGEVVDGDKNLFIIGRYLKEKGKLDANTVVGTSMTNMGIEKAFAEQGIVFERADVGDKYVMRRLLEKGGVLGGEGSGHTIMLNESATGDGVQTAVILSKIVKESGKPLSTLSKTQIFPQIISSIKVKDKEKIMSDERVIDAYSQWQRQFAGKGRILLRPSGTEQKIRIMVESCSSKLNENCVKFLTNIIGQIE